MSSHALVVSKRGLTTLQAACLSVAQSLYVKTAWKALTALKPHGDLSRMPSDTGQVLPYISPSCVHVATIMAKGYVLQDQFPSAKSTHA